ncbi:MAG: BON domain-containing protein [Ramlibacter sp.]|nr:BON domain-containing protein [Ramlibacter sp.]
MKPSERRCLAFSLLAVLLMLSACSPDASRVGTAPGDAASRAASATRTAGAASAAELKAAGAKAAEASAVAVEKILEQFEDAVITAKVTTGLAADKILTASRIQVATQDGVVTLKGPAPTPAARERATEIARNVKGVTSVNNQLSVGSG